MLVKKMNISTISSRKFQLTLKFRRVGDAGYFDANFCPHIGHKLLYLTVHDPIRAKHLTTLLDVNETR
jgi:hypothetical protein